MYWPFAAGVFHIAHMLFRGCALGLRRKRYSKGTDLAQALLQGPCALRSLVEEPLAVPQHAAQDALPAGQHTWRPPPEQCAMLVIHTQPANAAARRLPAHARRSREAAGSAVGRPTDLDIRSTCSSVHAGVKNMH